MPGFLLQNDADTLRQMAVDEFRKRADELMANNQKLLGDLLNPGYGQQPAPQQAAPQTAPAAPAEPQVDQSALMAYLSSPLGGQLTAGAPNAPAAPAQPTPASPPAAPSLPHAEEPATPADTVATPNIGGRWKTQFDFGSTYTGNYRTGTPHRGVDLVPSSGSGIGTEVDAFTPGTVTNISRDSGAGGLMVYVQDDQGLTHAYMHLAGVAPGLAVGQRVGRGTPIAQMGESGTEGSPHLHYEVRKNASTGDPTDQLIDPRPYIAGAPGGQRTASSGDVQTTAGLSGGGTLAGKIGERGQQILSQAADTASWLGEQGQKALQAVLVTEGGLSGARGDQGSSAGPLQFFGEEGGRAGQLNNFASALGMTLEQARQYVTEHPLDAIRWAIGTAAAPGYLGAVIGRGIAAGLTGPDLATYVQKNGQVSVSPERAGQVWNSLFGTGQRMVGGLDEAVTAATQAARTPPFTLPQGADFSDTLKQGQSLIDQGRDLLGGVQTQANEGITRWDQFRQEQADRIARGNQDLQSLLERGQQGLTDQLKAGLSSTLESPAAQEALNQPLPMTGGRSLADIGQDIRGTLELRNLDDLRRVLEAGEAESKRQERAGPVSAGLELGMGALGQQPSEELLALGRRAEEGMPGSRSASLDPGGVVSGMFKAGGLLATVPLPVLGDVPLADIIGLGVNTLTPMGAERTFGAGPLRTAVSGGRRAELEALHMAGAIPGQLGVARAIEQGVPRVVGGAADATRLATSAVGRWARASVEDIMQDLARGPIGEFLRDEAGTLDLNVLRGVATGIKDQMVRMYHGTTAEFDKVRTDLPAVEGENTLGPGYYVTPNPDYASMYARDWRPHYEEPSLIGGNVRAIDMPSDLKLFDLQTVDDVAPEDLARLIDVVRPQDFERARLLESLRQTVVDLGGDSELASPQDLWRFLTTGRNALSVTEANRLIEQAGYNGIRGGDEGTVIFGSSVNKLRNAVSGRQGGQAMVGPTMQLGTTVGSAGLGYATAPEGSTEEERLQRAAAFGLGAGTLAFGGPSLARLAAGGANTRALQNDVRSWLNATTPAQATARAVGQTLGSQTPGQRVAEWISSNILSGAGLVWNVINSSAHLAYQPLERALTLHPGEALQALQMVAASAGQALERGGTVFRTGAPYAGVQGQQSRPIGKLSLGLRANLAGDAVLRTLNENMAGMLEAQRLIREAGATTLAQKQAVIAQNAGRIADAAAREGNVAGLTQGQGRLFSTKVTQAKESLLRDPNLLKQGLGVLLHVAVPFARVPEEVLYQTFRHAPILGEVFDALQVVKAAPGDDRRTAIAKLGMNAAMTATMLQMVLDGRSRGPDDPEHPNQTQVGDMWLPTTALGTVGGRLAIVTAVVEGLQSAGKPTATTEQRIAAAVNNMGKLAESEWPLADQVRLLYRIGSGNLTGAASGFASDVLGGLTPLSGALGAAENVTDPYARQVATSGWGDVYEPNMARIPGLAGTLPTKVNQLTGAPELRPSSGPGALLRIQNQPKAQGSLAQEIVRLEKLGYQLPDPKQNPEQISYRGSTVPLSSSEGRALAVARGQLIQSQLEQYMDSPYWSQLTDDQKARIIARVISRASARNPRTFLATLPAEEVQTRLASGRRVLGRPEPVAV